MNCSLTALNKHYNFRSCCMLSANKCQSIFTATILFATFNLWSRAKSSKKELYNSPSTWNVSEFFTLKILVSYIFTIDCLVEVETIENARNSVTSLLKYL